MRLEFTTPDLKLSSKQLAVNIGHEAIEHFEQEAQERDLRDYPHNEAQDLLNLLHEGRFDPTVYVKATSKDIDWTSEIPLTPNELANICDIVLKTVDRMIKFSADPQKYYGTGETPYAAFMQDQFDEPGFTSEHAYSLNRLGLFLRNKYLMEIDEPENIAREKAKDNNRVCWRLLSALTSLLLETTENAKPDASYITLLNQVTNSIVNILESETIDRAGNDYTEFSRSLEQLLDLEVENRENFLKSARTLIERDLPNYLADKGEPTELQVAQLGDPDRPYRILRSGNLFYTYPPEDTPSSDVLLLPEPGSRPFPPRTPGVLKDISLYDSNGDKVYWGQLNTKDVADINGPLYLLSDSDSHINVPKWAIVHEQQQPVFLSGSEKSRLDLGYIRVRAKGLIYKGEYQSFTNTEINPGNFYLAEDESRAVQEEIRSLFSVYSTCDWTSQYARSEIEEIRSLADGGDSVKAYQRIKAYCNKVNWAWNYINSNIDYLSTLDPDPGMFNMGLMFRREKFLDEFFNPIIDIVRANNLFQGDNLFVDFIEKTGCSVNPAYVGPGFKTGGLRNINEAGPLFMPAKVNFLSPEARQSLTGALQPLQLTFGRDDTSFITLEDDFGFAGKGGDTSFVILGKRIARSQESQVYRDSLGAHEVTHTALHRLGFDTIEEDTFKQLEPLDHNDRLSDKVDVKSQVSEFIACTSGIQVTPEIDLRNMIGSLGKEDRYSFVRNSMAAILQDRYGDSILEKVKALAENDEIVTLNDFRTELQRLLDLNDDMYATLLQDVRTEFKRETHLILTALKEKLRG